MYDTIKILKQFEVIMNAHTIKKASSECSFVEYNGHDWFPECYEEKMSRYGYHIVATLKREGIDKQSLSIPIIKRLEGFAELPKDTLLDFEKVKLSEPLKPYELMNQISSHPTMPDDIT
jgi:hypothetical protein